MAAVAELESRCHCRQMRSRPLTRIVAAIVVIGVGLSLGFAWYWSHTSAGLKDAAPIIDAVTAFCRHRAAHGLALPPTITTRALTDQGFLRHEALSSLGGLDITISLTADETRPSEIFSRIQLPDGTVVASFADGSAHQFSARQAAAMGYLTNRSSERP